MLHSVIFTTVMHRIVHHPPIHITSYCLRFVKPLVLGLYGISYYII